MPGAREINENEKKIKKMKKSKIEHATSKNKLIINNYIFKLLF